MTENLKNRVKLIKRFCFLIIFLNVMSSANAQIDDTGLWLDASIQKSFTRNLDATITQQLRFRQDLTEVDALISDAGIEYAFGKKVKAGLHYRFINSNRENYYSKRHRMYFDLAWKEKAGILSFTLRERIQQQFNDYHSSETGKIPTWILRSKLAVKADLDKKYFPYVSGEIYYIIDNAKEDDKLVSRYRLEAGFEYKFNRLNNVNPFVLFQHNISTQFDQLVFGISYAISI